jgi:uncharacterized cupin superfamily protein
MNAPTVLIASLLATVSCGVQAAPEVLPLNACELRAMKLESAPPFPAEMILKGRSEHWQRVVHQGEVVVAIYEAKPALIDISDPFPYDEFVLVLEGQVTLTHIDGEKQTYKAGDTFLVPKGFLGSWDMPHDYRELIVVETKAWLETEE